MVKKITKDFNKNRKQEGLYFYRLLVSTQHKELAEAFVKCKSVANIRDLTFLSGRHGRLQNGILARSLFQEMNLHRPLELAPTTFGSTYWKTLHTPLSAIIGLDYIYGKYDYNMVTMTDLDGRKIYAITFEYKEKAKRPTLSGTLYVDANTYDMLSFKGRVDGITIMMFRDFVRMESDVELTMEMNFRQTKQQTIFLTKMKQSLFMLQKRFMTFITKKKKPETTRNLQILPFCAEAVQIMQNL